MARYTIWEDKHVKEQNVCHTKWEKKETLNYWIAQYSGVKKCTECDHVLPNVCSKNNCTVHTSAALEMTGNCVVEFVYIFPADSTDKRRWIGKIIHSDLVISCVSLHNHPVHLSLSHKLSSMVTSGIQKV